MEILKKETQQKSVPFELDALLHPAKAFAHPMGVVRDVDLTLNEKREILASWASDSCASKQLRSCERLLPAISFLGRDHGRSSLAQGIGLLAARTLRRRASNDQGAPLN